MTQGGAIDARNATRPDLILPLHVQRAAGCEHLVTRSVYLEKNVNHDSEKKVCATANRNGRLL